MFGEGMAKKISDGITSAMEDKVIGMMFGSGQPANGGNARSNQPGPRPPPQCHHSECSGWRSLSLLGVC